MVAPNSKLRPKPRAVDISLFAIHCLPFTFADHNHEHDMDAMAPPHPATGFSFFNNRVHFRAHG
eukprot:365959-Chlamydomonas_euryale.AAC.1